VDERLSTAKDSADAAAAIDKGGHHNRRVPTAVVLEVSEEVQNQTNAC